MQSQDSKVEITCTHVFGAFHICITFAQLCLFAANIGLLFNTISAVEQNSLVRTHPFFVYGDDSKVRSYVDELRDKYGWNEGEGQRRRLLEGTYSNLARNQICGNDAERGSACVGLIATDVGDADAKYAILTDNSEGR